MVLRTANFMDLMMITRKAMNV